MQEMVEEILECASTKVVELRRLKESYRALMDEKVTLAERLAVSALQTHTTMIPNSLPQGPAKLPLEILLLIAGFVAGNNNYGTLLSFCIMSKRIKEEMKSTFTRRSSRLISTHSYLNLGPSSIFTRTA